MAIIIDSRKMFDMIILHSLNFEYIHIAELNVTHCIRVLNLWVYDSHRTSKWSLLIGKLNVTATGRWYWLEVSGDPLPHIVMVVTKHSNGCYKIVRSCTLSLQWCHIEHNGISNHRCLDFFLKRLFRRRSKKTWKLRGTGLYEGSSPVTSGFPAQRTSNAENVPFDDVIMPH